MTHTRDLAPVYLTEHAIERFRERARIALGRRYSFDAARLKIASMLTRADVEHVRASVRAAQIRKHGHDSESWVCGGWRFVIVLREGTRVLVTCARKKPGENR